MTKKLGQINIGVWDWHVDYKEREIESNEIIQCIGIKSHSFILEIGAGSGHLSHHLTKQGNTVITTNSSQNEVIDCGLSPYVTPIFWEYTGLDTSFDILKKDEQYDYIIANANAMHSESGGPISTDRQYSNLVEKLLDLVKINGEIWLEFNPLLSSAYMDQYKIPTIGNSTKKHIESHSAYKIVRKK
jgi:2-polyprenyl-3-methyl-5-hydroxy-6-metoxy-1,4-benzoquinol methylase